MIKNEVRATIQSLEMKFPQEFWAEYRESIERNPSKELNRHHTLTLDIETLLLKRFSVSMKSQTFLRDAICIVSEVSHLGVDTAQSYEQLIFTVLRNKSDTIGVSHALYTLLKVANASEIILSDRHFTLSTIVDYAFDGKYPFKEVQYPALKLLIGLFQQDDR